MIFNVSRARAHLRPILLCFAYCCTLFSSVQAQKSTHTNQSKGTTSAQIPADMEMATDHLFDGLGNRYELNDLRVDDKIAYKPMPPVSLSGTSVYTPGNSGYFQMYLEDGCGMEKYATDPAHAARAEVLRQVLKDISEFVNSPLSSTGKKVNIWVRNPAAIITAGTGYVAAASPFYNVPGSSVYSGVVDNAVWTTIQSGQDAFTNVASPVIKNVMSSSGGVYYHGIVVVNTNLSWHTQLTSVTSAGKYDLYTTLLHEMVHSLGFVSLISKDGQSVLGNNFNYFTRYDLNLKTSSGVPLISRNSTCSNYQVSYNTSVNTLELASNPNYINCASTAVCSNSIKYHGSLPIPQHVYTPDCWKDGSSLSHFDDKCLVPITYPLQPPNSEDQYFCMGHLGGKIGPYSVADPGAMLRYLKPEEMRVLNDIGYDLKDTFGIAAHFSGVRYASALTGVNVAGINDGLNINGSYKYMSTNGSAVQINGIGITGLLANDRNALRFECLQEMYPGGGTLNIATGTASTTVNYTPPAGYSKSGPALFRYIPVSPTGKKGNITYVYLYINNSNCPVTACDMVTNGGFENGASCGSLTNTGVTADCWNASALTPDVATKNCVALPASATHPGSINVNNRYLQLFSFYNQANNITDVEGVMTMLSTPMIKGNKYKIGFWAKGTVKEKIQFGLSETPAPYIPSGASGVWPAAADKIISFEVDDVNWHYYSNVVSYNDITPKSFLYVYSTCFTKNGSLYHTSLDDISVELITASDTLSLPDSLTLCGSIPNLNQYMGQSGVYTGFGITENDGIYSLDGEVAYDSVGLNKYVTVTFTYTDNLGCVKVIYDQIKIVNAKNCCLSTSVFPGNSYTTIASSTITSNLAPGNYYLKNDLLISGNVTFDNCIIAIAPGVTINVAPGAMLTIDSSHLYTCDNMQLWNGIVLQHSGTTMSRLYLKNNTLIEDAVNAVYIINPVAVSTPYILSCDNVIFNKNMTAVNIDNYEVNAASYPFLFVNTIFTSRDFTGFVGYPYKWPHGRLGTTALNIHYTPSNNYKTDRNIDNPNALGTSMGYNKINTNIPTATRTGIRLKNVGTVVRSGSSWDYKEIEIGVENFSQNPGLQNLFDNLHYGVYATNSNIKSVNNAFQYMVPVLNTKYQLTQGEGIHTVAVEDIANYGKRWKLQLQSLAGWGNNMFYNCYTGVSAENYYEVLGYNSYMISNRENMFSGNCGYKIQSYRYGNIELNNNEINNISTGISFTAGTKTNTPVGIQYAGKVDIRYNRLSGNNGNLIPTPSMDYGVIVQNLLTSAVSGQAVVDSVHVDDNIFIGVKNGIGISNFHKQPVTSNFNSISLEPSGNNSQSGISHANCISNSIRDNYITSVNGGMAGDRVGIRSVSNTMASVICNRTTGMSVGFLFSGKQPKTKWYKNRMSDNDTGFKILNGFIGIQGVKNWPMNNVWAGNWAGRIQTLARNSRTDSSKFFVANTPDMYPTKNIGYGSGQANCMKYYSGNVACKSIEITNASSDNLCGQRPVWNGLAPEIGGGFDPGLTNGLVFPVEQDRTIWMTQLSTYRAMWVDTTIRDSSMVMRDFWNTATISRYKNISDIEDRILQADYTAAQLVMNGTSVMPAPGYVSGISGAVLTDVAGANNIVNNYLDYYRIYLAYQSDTLDAADTASIVAMAALCPFKDGDVVYQARALYNVVFDVIGSWDDNTCIPPGDIIPDEEGPQVMNKPAGEESMLNISQAYSLYPNPIQDELFLRQSVVDNDPLKIGVYSMVGQKITERDVQLNRGKGSVRINALAPGVYLLYIKDSLGRMYKLKFVKE